MWECRPSVWVARLCSEGGGAPSSGPVQRAWPRGAAGERGPRPALLALSVPGPSSLVSRTLHCVSALGLHTLLPSLGLCAPCFLPPSPARQVRLMPPPFWSLPGAVCSGPALSGPVPASSVTALTSHLLLALPSRAVFPTRQGQLPSPERCLACRGCSVTERD